MPVDPVAGLLAAVGVLGAIVGLRFLIALARVSDTESPLRRAVSRTGQWAMALAAGVGSAAGLGLVQFGDLVGGFVQFVVGHPYFVSNIGVIGLGAGGLSGAFQLSTSQFVGIAMAIVGAVFIAMEVSEDDA
ncbi:hypothetical protein [Halomicrobium salinisoli]|uniref:hypothetical protein n=1 Tax=Halomicrobium salinisoli TaxID=2878391 RepID=UPI001CF06C92|nr:hypothetical protein [Halomicrobium salinisoli]